VEQAADGALHVEGDHGDARPEGVRHQLGGGVSARAALADADDELSIGSRDLRGRQSIGLSGQDILQRKRDEELRTR
jgi:hypothetical protein